MAQRMGAEFDFVATAVNIGLHPLFELCMACEVQGVCPMAAEGVSCHFDDMDIGQLADGAKDVQERIGDGDDSIISGLFVFQF